MFSFHKPKIYRSIQGCCICRAKSSSSRFTDSKRYETDFFKCFLIEERRAGEICNACVLLVKRWKKLPAGSNRNWNHVVDARAGPGTKSMNKIKNKAKLEEKLLKKKHKHKYRKPRNVKSSAARARSSGGLSDDVGDYLSDHSSQTGDYLSDNSDVGSSQSGSKISRKNRRKGLIPKQYSAFLDLNYWKKEEVCCGTIFVGLNGGIVIDESLMHPCGKCSKGKSKSIEQETDDAQAASPAKSNQSEVPTSEVMNDVDDANDADSELDEIEDMDDLDDLDDEDDVDEEDDDDELMTEMDGDLIGPIDRVDEDDEGTDSGVGSQEMSTAEQSPHPAPSFQTAAAMMLHAMSTGADLSQSSLSSDEKARTASPVSNSESSTTTLCPANHSMLSSVTASQVSTLQMNLGC